MNKHALFSLKNRPALGTPLISPRPLCLRDILWHHRRLKFYT